MFGRSSKKTKGLASDAEAQPPRKPSKGARERNDKHATSILKSAFGKKTDAGPAPERPTAPAPGVLREEAEDMEEAEDGLSFADDAALDGDENVRFVISQTRAYCKEVHGGVLEQYYDGSSDARTKMKNEFRMAAEKMASHSARNPRIDRNYATRVRYQHLSNVELYVLMQYTGPAYAVLNGLLRGTIRSDLFTAFEPVARIAERAMEKVFAGKPDESRFKKVEVGRARAAIDDSKKALPQETYRGDRFTPVFSPVFQHQYKEGGTLNETAFLSTSLDRGIAESFSGGNGIVRTFRGVGDAGKDVSDISQVSGEAEVLFPPNQKFQVNRIEARLPGGETRRVPDPIKEFPHDNRGAADDPKAFNQKGLSWHVDVSVLPRGGSPAPASPAAGPASSGTAASESGEGASGGGGGSWQSAKAKGPGPNAAPAGEEGKDAVDPIAELKVIGAETGPG